MRKVAHRTLARRQYKAPTETDKLLDALAHFRDAKAAMGRGVCAQAKRDIDAGLRAIVSAGHVANGLTGKPALVGDARRTYLHLSSRVWKFAEQVNHEVCEAPKPRRRRNRRGGR